MPVETGSCLLSALHRFASYLVDAEQELNALNVFPVADRDTGTNLRRTVERLVSELEAAPDATSIGPAAAVAALEAARGNSGLICSQYLARFLACATSEPTFTAATLAHCLGSAAIAARSAVANPVEGTMLTVADAAAIAASGAAVPATAATRASGGTKPEAALPVIAAGGAPGAEVLAAGARRGSGSSLAEVAGVAHRRSVEALGETTGQLDVLTEAGVVDAGAAGMVLFFRALSEAIGAHTGDGSVPAAASAMGTGASVASRPEGDRLLEERHVGFELQFTADGPPALADELRRLLAMLGTDVVVSSSDGVVRAHVHAADIGPVLEAVIERVRPRNIVVEALMESTEV